MTDEDDRIDRAKRIRDKLNGGDADEDGDESNEEPAGEAPVDDEPAGDESADEGAEPVSADESATEPAADEDRTESEVAEPATETVDAAAAADAADGQSADALPKDGDAGEREGSEPDRDEAAEAAAAAAEAAAETIGAAADSGDEDDGESATMYVPGADVGDVEIDVAEMAEQAGLESVGAGETDEDAAARPAGVDADAGADTHATEETRVLEFRLGSERYCLEIDYVEEIVEHDSATRVPNTPEYVAGVVDLRGQITTVLDPKETFGIDGGGREEHVIVFDPDAFEEQGAIGWLVDGVDQVAPVSEDEVNEPPVEDDHVNGVVDRGDALVIWTSPVDAIEEATG